MLRSVLVTTFSVGLALGTVTTLDLSWHSAPAGGSTVSAPPPDLSWHVLPEGGKA
ncbi:hypothetical protein ABZ953_38470 [Streptomyces sp. NPDC046465]|uniref:hypothetical protein n=1 Tax=Streptomyces sp. NPDC046465 TaxID=3155810 RepID=UPI0033CAA7A5